MGMTKFYTDGEKIKVRKESVRKSREKIRILRQLNGLCTECGQPNDREGKQICTNCKDRAQENQRKRYDKKIAMHICIQCGKQNDRIGMKHCSTCSEKNRLRTKERRREKNECRV